MSYWLGRPENGEDSVFTPDAFSSSEGLGFRAEPRLGRNLLQAYEFCSTNHEFAPPPWYLIVRFFIFVSHFTIQIKGSARGIC